MIANSAYFDEMSHLAPFHQSLHFLVKNVPFTEHFYAYTQQTHTIETTSYTTRQPPS